MNRLSRGVLITATFSLIPGASLADRLPAVVIEDVLTINPNISRAPDFSRTRVTSADGGEFLSQVNGVAFG